MSPSEFALVGEADPWLTASQLEATKYHRAFSPYLINKILQTNPRLHSITLKNYGVYQTDIKTLQQYFRHRLVIKTAPLSATEAASLTDATKLGQIQSPSVSDIIKFTLLWSDNILADRLARTAAKKAGFATDYSGIQNVFEATLNSLQIPATGLQVFDGNGLSHDDRVSPRTIADLLVKIKDNPLYQPVIAGLPTAGKTGTLKNRFVNDAPNAVGLVKAKTGWINNSVALAGYVDVGNQKYVFAVIADHVKPYEVYRAQARVAIDKMLGTIATPPTNTPTSNN
jgi:PBP4 family serine-type D-alanyl-D-alanine carboxypeptidase